MVKPFSTTRGTLALSETNNYSYIHSRCSNYLVHSDDLTSCKYNALHVDLTIRRHTQKPIFLCEGSKGCKTKGRGGGSHTLAVNLTFTSRKVFFFLNKRHKLQLLRLRLILPKNKIRLLFNKC